MKTEYLAVICCLTSFSLFAMPSRSALQKVQGAVAELMADDMAAMKKGKIAPEKVAETALGYARESTDEASKFLFLKGAFGLFVQGRKYDEAVRTIETLTREVKDVPDKVVADIIREKLKRVSKKDGGAVFELYDRVDRRMRSAAELARLNAALKANPKDADARRQLAFAKATLGDWPGALGEFASVGGKMSEAAKAEQGGDSVAAADLWWGLSDDEDERTILREHAASLYRQAMEGGKLAGIKLALAKKRVAEVGAEASAPAAAEASPAEAAQSEPKPALKKPAPALAVRGKYDWTIPSKLSKPKRVDFDFGGGVEKLSFFAVSAGGALLHGTFVAASKTKVEVKMTRPFWMAQWPVTVPQYKLFSKADCRRGTEELHEKLSKDDDLRVFAITTMKGLEEYIAWLNETYGKLLPKGWVFRQPTMAEARLSWKMLGDAHYDRDESKLKPLQKYGLYTEFSSVKEIGERILKDGDKSPFFHGILSGARQGKKFNLVWTPGYQELCLDRISTPNMPIRNGWRPEACQYLEPIVDCKATMTDPFWYCSPDAPARRCPTTLGVWSLTDGEFDEKFPIVIRLVVGYDYVGEWKAKNGK